MTAGLCVDLQTPNVVFRNPLETPSKDCISRGRTPPGPSTAASCSASATLSTSFWHTKGPKVSPATWARFTPSAAATCPAAGAGAPANS
eukprot:1188171-Prorocentrum_minimum.AAC.2